MILLIEHDGGIDGWDASSTIVAVYETKDHVVADLQAAGYTDKGDLDHYYHQEHSKRWCMGAISYSLEEEIPFNEYDFPHR